jgi:2-oxo-3-hexenedioate decarboxylase
MTGTARIEEIAQALAAARKHRAPIERIITRAEATLDDAYAVQFALMAHARSRTDAEGVGGGLRGFKVGTTSAAAMARVGVEEPMLGFIEHADAVPNGGLVDLRELIAPRIEMELALVTRVELSSPDCDAEAALAATDYAVPAFEIIDSRYVLAAFDVIAAVADNMSTARHVLGGERLDPRAVDLAAVTAVLEKNGVEIARGSGAAVLGHPARSLAWLVRTLARYGITVPAGSVVLTGGFADAVPAANGDAFAARFTPGGTVACTFSSSSERRT